MGQPVLIHTLLMWSIVILFAWVSGEFGYRYLKLPPNLFYIGVGFLAAAHQLGILPPITNKVSLLAINLALGLSLFEFGYRINLEWIKQNIWLLWLSVAESSAVFIGTYLILSLMGYAALPALIFASLTMATSPVVILYLANFNASAGQVTEQILHLTFLNWTLAIFCFKLIFGVFIYQQTGSVPSAIGAGVMSVLVALVLGLVVGIVSTKIFSKISFLSEDRTTGLLLVVMVLIAAALAIHLSSLLVSMAFGLSLRHQKVILGHTQQALGGVGEVALIIFFIATPTILDWHNLNSGITLAILLFLVRIIIKVGVIGFSPIKSAVTRSKKILTGIALTPISLFPLLLLDQNSYSGVMLIDHLAPFTACILFLDLIGPWLTQVALIKARECRHESS